MIRKILSSILFLLIHFFANAQKGNNNIMAHVSQTINLYAESLSQENKIQPGYFNKDTILNPTKDAAYYQALSKKKKSAAITKLSIGVVLTGVGLLIGNSKKSSFDDAATGVIIALPGIALAISSIPTFSKAYKYKQKAALMISNRETGKGLFFPGNNKGTQTRITGLSLIIPVGKNTGERRQMNISI